MSIAEIAALGAAACWALGSLFSVTPVKEIGPIPFVRIRAIIVISLLSLYLLVTGQFSSALFSISAHDTILLIISGIIGIWFGDMMLFITVDRLGPRRSSILFATNAPMQVLLGMFFLGETMSAMQFVGCVLVMIGVYCAIVFGKRKEQQHHWESVKGLLIVGVAFGLCAGFGQALGALISKPIMDKGTSAQAAVIIRGAAALAIFYLCMAFPIPNQRLKKPLTLRIISLITISDLFGMAIGMSLLMYAMGHGDLGKVAMLSALTPVLLLPLLWIKTRERPALGAWLGAMLAVAGVILLR